MTAAKRSQADELVQLAEEHYWFGAATSGEPFAVPHDGAFVARMLRGGRDSLRAELAAEYARVHSKVPSASALADAALVFEGRAQAGPRIHLGLRVATGDDGELVVDLGDDTGRAAVVRPGGWKLVDRSPVLFRRTELTSALPAPPRSGGDLDRLRALLNVSAASWPLVVAWLVAALFEDAPHPVLALLGEQGVGKSTAARLLTATVDPSPAPLRTAPRDPEAWAVAASGSWVVGVDNVSRIAEWLSDALCRAVTGDGLVRRRLYSDSALTVLAFRRAVVLTSIDPGAMKGDLADRLLAVELDRIPAASRRLDADLEAAFTAAHPAILAGLFDLAAAVLEVLPDVHLKRMPRMADFARIAAAVDRVNGTDALGTYVGQGSRVAEDVVEGDPVAAAVRAHVDEVGAWEGTAGQLHTLLSPERPPKGWPASPQSLVGRLRRCAPALRAVGVQVEYDPAARPRRWTLTRGEERSSDASDGSDGTAQRAVEQPNSAVTLPVTSPSLLPSDGGSDGTTDGENGALDPISSPSVSPVTPVTRSADNSGCRDCGDHRHRWCGGAA